MTINFRTWNIINHSTQDFNQQIILNEIQLTINDTIPPILTNIHILRFTPHQ